MIEPYFQLGSKRRPDPADHQRLPDIPAEEMAQFLLSANPLMIVRDVMGNIIEPDGSWKCIIGKRK